MSNCMGISTIMIMLLFLQHFVAVASPSLSTTYLSPEMQKLALFEFKLHSEIHASASPFPFCGKFDTVTWHSKMMNWSMSSDCCTWDGVSCNLMTRDVIGLDLSCSYLVGTIPPNSTLFQLSLLQFINMDFNDLHGVLPEEIFHLPNLKKVSVLYNSNLIVSLPKVKWGSSSTLQMLSFGNAALSRGMPDSIGYLKSLTFLSLSHCSIYGSIPTSISNLTQLTYLDLSYNYFSGRIPSWISNLRQLNTLDISDNSLTGPLPSKLTALSLPKLSSIDLSNNSLNGTIPSWLFQLPSLTELDIASNEFTGQLHEFTSSKSLLQYFSCSNNLLNGTILQSFSEHVNLVWLDVSFNNFSGVLDVETFSHLEHLFILSLSHNSLSLRITSTTTLTPKLEILGLSSCKIMKFPHFIKSLANLTDLDLSNNQIDGKIPPWIGSLGLNLLSNLDLSHNSLTGGLEYLPWMNIRFLHLQSNLFNGSLPTSICNSSSLYVLNMAHNNFSGVLPTCPSTLNYRLWVFDLRINSIEGILPSSLSNFRELRTLNLYGNKLEGTIPLSFAEFNYLEVLDLGSNQIYDTFPQWLETLQNLQVLVLKSNKFHGTIDNISKIEHPFVSLRIIDLSDNEFSGPLPAIYIKNFKGMMSGEVNKVRGYMGNFYYSDTIITVIKGVETEYVKILSIFTTIDLSRNKFEGEIPEYIGDLKSLINLNLSHNHLTGHIPSSVGNLLMLESLDLSLNRLVGLIPQQLRGIYSLSRLNLSHNDLSGHIPVGAQFHTFQNDSYLGNLALCGHPLSKMCVRETIEKQEEENEDDDYIFSGFTWQSVMIGYGSGVVVGFIVGYVTFMTREPKWFTRIIWKKMGAKVRRHEIRSFF